MPYVKIKTEARYIQHIITAAAAALAAADDDGDDDDASMSHELHYCKWIFI